LVVPDQLQHARPIVEVGFREGEVAHFHIIDSDQLARHSDGFADAGVRDFAEVAAVFVAAGQMEQQVAQRVDIQFAQHLGEFLPDPLDILHFGFQGVARRHRGL
jgi:hypothetical protein